MFGRFVESVIPMPDESGRRVGLEIEVENGANAPGGLKTWRVDEDHSLRNNGLEFISQPVTMGQLPSILDEVYKPWPHMKYEVTHRTGIHVHVDARDFDQESLRSLCATYSFVEPALFEFVGQDREECIYCVPWYRANTDADAISNILYLGSKGTQPERVLHKLSRDTCKYSAFFVGPLSTIGTVEFRQAPTWETPVPLLNWATYCYNVVEYAKKHNVAAIIDTYDNIGAREFAYEVLGPIHLPGDYESRVLKVDSEAVAGKFANQGSLKWKRVKTNFEDKREKSTARKGTKRSDRLRVQGNPNVQQAREATRRWRSLRGRPVGELDPFEGPTEPEPEDTDQSNTFTGVQQEES